MKYRSTFLVVALVLFSPSVVPARAEIVQFMDRAAWESAVSGILVEDFSGGDFQQLWGTPYDVAFSGFNLSGDGDEKVAANRTSDLEVRPEDLRVVNTFTNITFTRPVIAFGFDYVDVNSGGRLDFTNPSLGISIPEDGSGFIGVLKTDGFLSDGDPLVLSGYGPAAGGGQLLIDNISTASLTAIPEPSSVAFLAPVGTAWLVLRRRSRRRTK